MKISGGGRLRNLILVIVSVPVALVALELLLVLVNYRYYPLKIELQKGDSSDWRYYHILGDKYFVHDPVLLWRPRPGYKIFNAQGLRGPVLAKHKPAGEFRIFAIGDSNTLGYGGTDGANWPASLGALMAARDPGVKVVNAGAWGYSSHQGLLRFREVLPFEPDLVLISFGANDAHPVPVPDADFPTVRILHIQLSRFRIGQVLLGAWYSAIVQSRRSGSSSIVHRVDPSSYQANLHEIARLSAQNGIICVFLTRPYIGTASDPRNWKFYAADYLTATRDAAATSGAFLIDVQAAFRDQPAFFADESHFTDDGHAKAAALIDSALAPIVRDAMARP